MGEQLCLWKKKMEKKSQDWKQIYMSVGSFDIDFVII